MTWRIDWLREKSIASPLNSERIIPGPQPPRTGYIYDTVSDKQSRQMKHTRDILRFSSADMISTWTLMQNKRVQDQPPQSELQQGVV